MRAVRLVAIVLAGGLPLAACASGESAAQLTGDWGGPSMRVIATAENVDMMLGCSATVRIAHGIVLGASGEFNVSASLRGSLDGGMPDTLQAAVPTLITGALRDGVLTVDLSLPQSANPRGVNLKFDGRRGEAGPTLVCQV